jgi:hypothetical protein
MVVTLERPTATGYRADALSRVMPFGPTDDRPYGFQPLAPDLAAEINASRSMLELEDDWDGEGSPGYEEATWRRAVDFLVRNASRLNNEYGLALQSPRIRKGPRGSIDLHWHVTDRELLVNIPAKQGLPADYYGDDGAGGQQIKGTLDPEIQGYHLMLWLVT